MKNLTIERLRETIEYRPNTGEVIRLSGARRRDRNGKIAGTVQKSNGYRRVYIDGAFYYAHRLAWLYVYGEWPIGEIDHINGDRLDNRIENLRVASRKQNGCNLSIKSNNTSGYPGISFDKRRSKWEAHITKNYKKKTLGFFLDISDAIVARKKAEATYFGVFARR